MLEERYKVRRINDFSDDLLPLPLIQSIKLCTVIITDIVIGQEHKSSAATFETAEEDVWKK